MNTGTYVIGAGIVNSYGPPCVEGEPGVTPPPPGEDFIITNAGNFVIDNAGDRLITV